MLSRLLLYVLAVLLLGLLFVGKPHDLDFPLLEELWNLGHIVAFALWTYLLLTYTPVRHWPWVRQTQAVLVLALAAAVLTEGLQVSFDRTPDMGDVLRDLLGSAIALGWLTPARPKSAGALKALRITSGIGILLAFVPVGMAALDEIETRRNFPLLADFESERELRKWEGKASLSLSRDVAARGDSSLRLDLGTTRYSGAYLQDFPRDWSSFRHLHFSTFNPSEEVLELHLRINDGVHRKGRGHYEDRFNRSFQIAPGWNELRVDLSTVAQAPKERRMEMDRIAMLAFFTTQLPYPRTLYLDDIRLEE